MKHILISLIILIGSVSSLNANNNILKSRFKSEFLKDNLISQNEFTPFPIYKDSRWNNIDDSIKESFIKQGELYIEESWPAIPADQFIRFRKDGNRGEYEKHLFGRRDKLIKLTIAELFEQEGRFMPTILNGLWAVCEESWWGTSAHYGPNLPNVELVQDVDLFQAETASMVAIINYLFKDSFKEISPLISKRVNYEIKRRMLEPCMTKKYWWMNVGMNWNPWIVSNWLYCVLLEENDENKKIESLARIFGNLDSFIDSYPKDGGCDEGPGYWGHAAGSLFDCLDLLKKASNNSINIFDVDKIQQMGQFVCRSYIGENYYINFADAKPSFVPDAGLVYRFGTAINNSQMITFASDISKSNNYCTNLSSYYNRPFLSGFGRILNIILELSDFDNLNKEMVISRDLWLEELQVFSARNKANSTKGFFIAAKGGHNNEAHNHNDVGNYILYYDSKPLIIDLGVGTYEKKTFNHERYTIWTMQSDYHNVPQINGVSQKDGKEFQAKNVSYKSSNNNVSFCLDISQAYPKSAKVEKWERNINFRRNRGVEIKENFKLEEYITPSIVNIVTIADVTIVDKKEAILNIDDNIFSLFCDRNCEINSEKIEIKDPVLIKCWGNVITRISIKCIDGKSESAIRYRIEK